MSTPSHETVWRAIYQAIARTSVTDHRLATLALICKQHTGSLPELQVDPFATADAPTLTAISEALTAAENLPGLFDYALGEFTAMAGRAAGEFYTPSSIAELFAQLLPQPPQTVFDPCAGSAGLLMHVAQAHDATGISGIEFNPYTHTIGQLNLSVHGFDPACLAPSDTFTVTELPQADAVVSVPPYGVRRWEPADVVLNWPYGTPPRNNADFAWLQTAVKATAPGGMALSLSPAGTSFRGGNEGRQRAAMLEDDVVSALIFLPANLLPGTAIPTLLWVLEPRKPATLAGQILFIDASNLGTRSRRARQELSTANIKRIASTFHAWRQASADGASADDKDSYKNVQAFCQSVSIQELRNQDYMLSPELLIEQPLNPEDSEPADLRVQRLSKQLEEALDASAAHAAAVREQIKEVLR